MSSGIRAAPTETHSGVLGHRHKAAGQPLPEECAGPGGVGGQLGEGGPAAFPQACHVAAGD